MTMPRGLQRTFRGQERQFPPSGATYQALPFRQRNIQLADGTVLKVQWAKLLELTDASGKPLSVYVPILPWSSISKAQYPVIWQNITLVDDTTGELVDIGGDTVIDEQTDAKGNITQQTTLGEILNSEGWDYSGIVGGATYQSAIGELKASGISGYTLSRPEVDNWLVNSLKMMFGEGKLPTPQDISSFIRIVPALKNMELTGKVPDFLSAFEEKKEVPVPPSLQPRKEWEGLSQEQMLAQYQPYKGNVITADEVRAGRKPTPDDIVVADTNEEANALGAYQWIPSSQYDPLKAKEIQFQQENLLKEGFLTHPNVEQTGRYLSVQQKFPIAEGMGGFATQKGIEEFGAREAIERKKQQPILDWEKQWQVLARQAKANRPGRVTRL